MATKIVTKNSSTAGSAPLASDLVQGELAVNVTDKRLYTENASGVIVEVGTNPSAEIIANAGIALPDSQKATFGASDDLQIYHDGNNSYISDVGAGQLIITSDGTQGIYLQKGATETLAAFKIDSSVDLYYDNAKKFATTSTGIDVTGTATMDGLTVDGAAVVRAGNTLTLNRTDNAIGGAMSYVAGTGFIFNDANGDGTSFNVGAANRMRIDSSGNVGIGTSSPSAPLDVVSNSGSTGVNIRGRSSDNIGSLYFTSNASAATEYGFIQGRSTDLRIQGFNNGLILQPSSGNVGIGTTSPGAKLEAAGNLRITNATVANSAIFQVTSDATGSNGVNLEATYYGSGGFGPIKFTTSNTERMRIDSSGNLLVGKSAFDDGATKGFTHYSGGGDSATFSTRSNNPPLNLNRLNSDGEILRIRKDGTTVGSIGSASGVISYIVLDPRTAYKGAGLTGASLSASVGILNPTDKTGAIADNAINLGNDSSRFRDLYLSGGVYLGGTGAANKLDDYEEGTFTPTLYGSGSSATTLLTALGRYVKVGKSVTCWIEISCDGSTTLPTGNYISLAGLPFSPVSSRTFISVVRVTGLTGLASGTYFVGVTSSGTTVNLEKMNQDGIIGSVGLTAASLTSTFGAASSITYEVA